LQSPLHTQAVERVASSQPTTRAFLAGSTEILDHHQIVCFVVKARNEQPAAIGRQR
jgi:hypothetical protein